MFENLPEGHMLTTLFKEHEQILHKLDELEKTAEMLSTVDADARVDFLKKANGLVSEVLGAEPHHQREEEVLFPVLEELGIAGPPNMMRTEHDMMRQTKHALEESTRELSGHWPSQLSTIEVLTEELCTTLRHHIYKEDNILYPMALDAIESQEQWANMKAECDRIGYCSFYTPET
jgi:hypothetical protein